MTPNEKLVALMSHPWQRIASTYRDVQSAYRLHRDDSRRDWLRDRRVVRRSYDALWRRLYRAPIDTETDPVVRAIGYY